MKQQELVAQSGDVFIELWKAIEKQELDLMAVEEQIQQFLNRIGDLILQKMLNAVSEPFIENHV